MAEVNQRLELVHLSAQLIDLVRCLPLRLEKRISLRHVRREDFVLDGEIHFRRKIIDAVVAANSWIGMSWIAVTPRLARCGIFCATSRNVPALAGRFGGKKRQRATDR